MSARKPIAPEEQCAHRVYARDNFDRRGHFCSRRAVVTEKGQGWCHQHAPSTIEAKRKAAEAAFDAGWNARKRQEENRKRLEQARERVIEAARVVLTIYFGPDMKALRDALAAYDAARSPR